MYQYLLLLQLNRSSCSPGTVLSTDKMIAQMSPSTSGFIATSDMHHPVRHQEIAEEPTHEDPPINHDVLHPSHNLVTGDPGSAQSSSGNELQSLKVLEALYYQAKYALKTLRSRQRFTSDLAIQPRVDRLKTDEELMGIPVTKHRFKEWMAPNVPSQPTHVPNTYADADQCGMSNSRKVTSGKCSVCGDKW
ncbi:hypothetical protein Tco_1237864 [Tanacetum coccineum]